MPDDDLPPELLLAIQSALNNGSENAGDPLEDVSSNFDVSRILNGFFPDGIGAQHHSQAFLTDMKLACNCRSITCQCGLC